MVPRTWLFALATLITVPWLIVAALYLWRPGEVVPPAPAPAEAPDSPLAAGPWGALLVTQIVISPPLELIADDWARNPDSGTYWFFPATTAQVAEAFLLSTGLTREQVSRLMSTARPEPRIDGHVITPEADLLRALTPEVRARIYVQLAKSAHNVDHAQAFRYAGDSIEAWLGPTLISAATRRLIEPLIYRHGRHLYFADAALARRQIADSEELRRLAKALLRQTTLRVRLSVSDASQVSALATYWGRGGRRTDIRPLLESLAGATEDRAIDITHLLPEFARSRLYRYPRLTVQALDRPALANCLWSSLNFFSAAPDDRFLDIGYAVERLKQDYYVVESHFELGDIVAILDENDTLIHTAVHVADNLVFTKNGMSPVAPWVILPLGTVVDYYRTRSEKPRLIYHRRRDF
jgi:hypothetical protein